jgi:hypothetical protein
MSDFICIPILHSSQGARVRKSSVDAVVPQSDGNTLVVCGAESWLSTMTCDEIMALIEGPPPSQTDCESRQLRRPGCIATAEYERMCWHRFATFGEFVTWAEKVKRIHYRASPHVRHDTCEFKGVYRDFNYTWEGCGPYRLASLYAWTPEAEYCAEGGSDGSAIVATDAQQANEIVTPTDDGWRTFKTFDEFCEWAKGKTFEARHYGDGVRATRHTFSRSTDVAPYWRDSAGTIWCCHPIHSYREVKP